MFSKKKYFFIFYVFFYFPNLLLHTFYMAGPDMQKIRIVRKYKDIKQKQDLLRGCDICDDDDSMYIVLCDDTPFADIMDENRHLLPIDIPTPRHGKKYVYMRRAVVDYMIDYIFKYLEESRQYVKDNYIDLTSIPE